MPNIVTAQTPRVAAYLRCYPHDIWEMAPHRVALEELAVRRGWPYPALFIDNGRSSRDSLPRLLALQSAVRNGIYDTVLVPGMWVFSLGCARAHEIVADLARYGCHVYELPRVPRVAHPRHRECLES